MRWNTQSKRHNFFAKSRRLAFILTLIVSLSAGILLQVNSFEQSGNTVNWINWIAGQSVSADFHYFDLLELLFKLHQSDS